MLASLEATAASHDFPVWQDNWAALQAFLAVNTQWRAVAGPEGSIWVQGLDYAGVAAGLTGAGIAATPELWSDLRIMEAAARNQLNGNEVMDEA